MATKRTTIAPITVYTNGNKYDAKRFIFNPKYVRTFDAFLDQITMQTNATCAVRKIYTPHGSRRVGALANIEPGGHYVAVSQGNFKKISYGEKIDMGFSSTGTTTTKSPRKHKSSGRLKRSYEDQMKTQKTLFVHRNGFNEPPTQIFFTKRLLRNLSQVLDIIQEKIPCDRAIVSLHKLNGVTINDVSKLQPEGRYVAVEQGQRFRHCTYDHLDTGDRSPRRVKLPVIRPQRVGQKSRPTQPTNESQEMNSRSKQKIKLPAIKTNVNDPGFHVVYGYPDKHEHETQFTQNQHAGGSTNRNTQGGPFHASGAQKEFAIAVRDDKRVRVEKPLDMMPADEVEEQLDGVDHHSNDRRKQIERRVKPITRSNEISQQMKAERQSKETVALPQIDKVHHPPANGSSFPTKPSIAHPRRHKHAQKGTTSKSVVKDQRFVSQDNNIATKRYVVTREQRLFGMHGRDGREQAKDVVHVYETGARIKGVERENRELEKRKRIEEWVDHTIEVKEKEDEIIYVAKQLVTSALANAAKSLDVGNNDFSAVSYNDQNNGQTKPSFYEENSKEVKYHRVFGQ
ncbi:doublecortin domain-containing protein 2C-like isoform X2 [Dendronephthya gigantea]|nr:doublecortin domain-containing protein 2C-like isoform X2 [Dendronephthya gigantea]